MCQAGEEATGGGISSSDAGLAMFSSVPLEGVGNPTEAGETPVGWGGHHDDNNGLDTTTAFVVCVS
jgi:hypothetical protein